MLATITTTTCADVCWYAREDVCRCMCMGINHGVLLELGVEQPIRTRRIKNTRYELREVVIGYGDAYGRAREISKSGHVKSAEWAKVGDTLVQSAPESKFGKWRELDGFSFRYGIQDNPYLVWQRVG